MSSSHATETLPSRKHEGGDDFSKVMGLVAIFREGDGGLPPAQTLRRACKIGRDHNSDIVVDDPKVSRNHAEVVPTDDGVLVADLGSRNGTFVNGKPFEGIPVRADIGSVIRTGNTIFVLVRDGGAYRGFSTMTDESLVGGPSLSAVRQGISEASTSKIPVLLEGETGTGKEKLAEAIHESSGRSGELIAVNCAAFPSELVESELFGHAKGAFSGSLAQRKGVFRAADKGTLLLDEIGELPLAAQAKLLRVLETGEVRAVGDDRGNVVDVRVLGATHRNLEEMVALGSFRADLFHRVAALRIRLPALRERIEDVPLFARHFLQESGLPVSADAMEKLLLWGWPGNIRELRNVLLAAAARVKARGGDSVGIEHLPDAIISQRPSLQPVGDGVVDQPTAAEDAVLKARVETALRLRLGNVSHVAKDLNIRRAGLYELFQRFGIDPSAYRRR